MIIHSLVLESGNSELRGRLLTRSGAGIIHLVPLHFIVILPSILWFLY